MLESTQLDYFLVYEFMRLSPLHAHYTRMCFVSMHKYTFSNATPFVFAHLCAQQLLLLFTSLKL